jgi:hypothetical protein
MLKNEPSKTTKAKKIKVRKKKKSD